MTNSDALHLISTTTNVVEATAEDYSRVKDDKALRHAFHESGRDLLLVNEALGTARDQLRSRALAGQSQLVMRSLDACKQKALLSSRIFADVACSPEIERLEYYKAAVRRAGNGNTVEVLVKGMMDDVCGLAQGSALGTEMQNQVRTLHDAIDRLSAMGSSVEASGNTFNNNGQGFQFNSSGGTQNNNTGSGNMFAGATFPGTVNFGVK